MSKPVNADRRLAEIILKACAFNPKDRYESPLQMREELENILYSENEEKIIYPEGEVLEFVPTDVSENEEPDTRGIFDEINIEKDEKTIGFFSSLNIEKSIQVENGNLNSAETLEAKIELTQREKSFAKISIAGFFINSLLYLIKLFPIFIFNGWEWPYYDWHYQNFILQYYSTMAPMDWFTILSMLLTTVGFIGLQKKMGKKFVFFIIFSNNFFYTFV